MNRRNLPLCGVCFAVYAVAILLLILVHEGEEGGAGVRILHGFCWGAIGATGILQIVLVALDKRRQQRETEDRILGGDADVVGVTCLGDLAKIRDLYSAQFVLTGFSTRDSALVRGFYEGDDEAIRAVQSCLVGNLYIKAARLESIAGKTVFVQADFFERAQAECAFSGFFHNNQVEIVENL